MSDTIAFAKLKTPVGYCICEIRDVEDIIEAGDTDPNWGVVHMTREQFEALPEFEGTP